MVGRGSNRGNTVDMYLDTSGDAGEKRVRLLSSLNRVGSKLSGSLLQTDYNKYRTFCRTISDCFIIAITAITILETTGKQSATPLELGT